MLRRAARSGHGRRSPRALRHVTPLWGRASRVSGEYPPYRRSEHRDHHPVELGRVAVVARGGSALPLGAGRAEPALRAVALGAVELGARGWRVVVTHATGPYLARA